MNQQTQQYRNYQKLREKCAKRICTSKVSKDVLEKIDRNENYLYQRALLAERLAEEEVPASRKSRIFVNFTAEELRNHITRASWLEALHNTQRSES